MKSLFSLLVLAGMVSVLNAACQNDMDTCKATYEHGLPDTVNKPGALCMLGNNYISCLRNLTSSPACANLTKALNEHRRKTEELLNHNATGCMLCTSEVDKCEATFRNSSSQAGHNITAVCKDGQTMVLCLENVDKRTECAAEKARLEESRRKAEEKLNVGGCDTGHTCLRAIQACETQEKAGDTSAATHAQQCQVAKTFYGCLNAVTGCTGEYAKALKIAIDKIVVEATAGNCSFTTDAPPSGTGVTTSGNALMSLVVVVVAVVAKLY